MANSKGKQAKQVANSQVTEVIESGPKDYLLYLISTALVLGAAWFNVSFAEGEQQIALLYRVLAVVAILLLALGVFALSNIGKKLITLFKESRLEFGKITWPKKHELTRMTIVVSIMIVVFAIFLLLLDMFLGWIFSFIIG